MFCGLNAKKKYCPRSISNIEIWSQKFGVSGFPFCSVYKLTLHMKLPSLFELRVG